MEAGGRYRKEKRVVTGGLSVKLKGRAWCPDLDRQETRRQLPIRGLGSWERSGWCRARGQGMKVLLEADTLPPRWSAASGWGCHRGGSSGRAPVPTSMDGECLVLSKQLD